MAMPAWVPEVGVVAQIAIAIMAIFGERVRAWLSPRLRLELLDPHGQIETLAVRQADAASVQFTPARYYHLRVTNHTAHPEAREVEVLLTQLDLQGPDGKPQAVFSGALPLNWQHYDLRSRTIGRASLAVADLLAIHAGINDSPPTLFFSPLIRPISFPAEMIGGQHFWLTLIARGLNGESNTLRLRVDWDGSWDRGDAEMARRLIVTAQS
jgi:hypothetical protein